MNISESYNKYRESDIYKNYDRNRALFLGKSADVFYQDVIQRVKLEYMGVITRNDNYPVLLRNTDGKGYIIELKPFKPLVVGNNILGAVTKLYAEFAANVEPQITIKEKALELLKNIDLQEKTEEAMCVQSYAGKLLLKGAIEEQKIGLEIIEPNQYFEIKKYDKTESYVIYAIDKKTLLTEIYSLGKTEYREYVVKKKELIEVEYRHDLTEYGAIKNGLGYVKYYDGWQVVEINNLFKRSDYLEDLVVLNRELVIGDTLTSQAFDKVANPLLQIPEGSLEYDEQGSLKVNIKDRLLIVNPEDKELKQIALETKTAEWNLHRANLIEQIYQNLGVNEQAFGLNKNGIASGEAKRRDLERTLSTVMAKRDKIYLAFEKILKWGYKEIYKEELDIKINGKDILVLSTIEKIQIAVQGITAGILSLESAIKFINISDSSEEEEIQKIKSNIAYKEKLITMLQMLNSIDTENRIAGSVKDQVDDLIKELKLDEKESISS